MFCCFSFCQTQEITRTVTLHLLSRRSDHSRLVSLGLLGSTFPKNFSSIFKNNTFFLKTPAEIFLFLNFSCTGMQRIFRNLADDRNWSPKKNSLPERARTTLKRADIPRDWQVFGKTPRAPRSLKSPIEPLSKNDVFWYNTSS